MKGHAPIVVVELVYPINLASEIEIQAVTYANTLPALVDAVKKMQRNLQRRVTEYLVTGREKS